MRWMATISGCDFEQGRFRLRRIEVSGEGIVTETLEVDRGPALFGKIETLKQMTKN